MQIVAIALLGVTACPQRLVKVFFKALHLRRCPTKAHKHRRIISRERIHCGELMLCEPFGHEECSKRDEGDDEDRETDGSDCLRNSDGTGNPKGLQSDIKPDFAAWDSVEWILRVHEALFGVQIPELRENAVALDGTPLRGMSIG